jgi:integrase
MTRRGNGEGSIYRRKDKRWEAIVDVGVDDDGQRKRKSIYGRTRHEVAEKLDADKASRGVGPVAGPDETVGSFLTRWVDAAGVRESTRDHYRRYVRRHLIPTLGRVALQRLTIEHVEGLLRSKLEAGLAPQSVHHIRAILRNGLARALRNGLVTRNVAELADPPHVAEYEPRFLTVDEARAFLAAAEGDRLETLYSVALALGLREGEALGLRWVDVDLEAKSLHVARTLQRIPGKGLQLLEPKTAKSRRTIALPDRVLRTLRAQRARQLEERVFAGAAWQEQGLVFTTLQGRPLSATHVINGSFRRICDRAGIAYGTRGRRGLRFHDLRHSAATLLLAQGVPQRVVMEQLGHSTLAMTQKYTHVLPQLMTDAAAAMDRALGS